MAATDVSVNVITTIFRAYLVDQSIDHLAATLKRGAIKDLLAFFPPNRREDKVVDEHFRKAGLPQVADWWTKRQYASLKEGVIKTLRELLDHDTPHAEVRLSTCLVCRSLMLDVCAGVVLDRGCHQEQAGRAAAS